MAVAVGPATDNGSLADVELAILELESLTVAAVVMPTAMQSLAHLNGQGASLPCSLVCKCAMQSRVNEKGQ